MNFTFRIKNPNQQYIQITAEFEVNQEETIIYFPHWRPGRYEAGNFVKNVNHFQVLDQDRKPIPFKKKTLNSWVVYTKNSKKISVSYSYYAAELNAGSTYLDVTQLYVNPVNCCIFTDETANSPIHVKLEIPKEWKIAHSLKVENTSFTAKNYDELADSPFICSNQLQHYSYTAEGVLFHVWFNGLVKVDEKRLIHDFQKFSIAQIKKYKAFPVSEYHFLFQIVPYNAYHGVEHCRSTVIALGPSYAIFEELYSELLGVSSHELYHSWNVKSIRPKEWMPYNFKTDSPSELGYIAEGITTYQGDLMLLKGGVFSIEEYLLEMNTQLKKHFDNFGNSNYSVAQSSFDTWLDGYVPGVPNRKVSIYTEGCLLAFIIDVLLIKNSNLKYNIDDVMLHLYENFGKKQIGVTRKDYQTIIEQFSGISFEYFFNNYIYGTEDYTPMLKECFNYLGLTVNEKPSNSLIEAKLGVKISPDENEILAIHPDSPMERAGAMLGDKIIAINQIKVNQQAERWYRFFKGLKQTITVERKGLVQELSVTSTNKTYYKQYFVTVNSNLTVEQKAALNRWKG